MQWRLRCSRPGGRQTTLGVFSPGRDELVWFYPAAGLGRRLWASSLGGPRPLAGLPGVVASIRGRAQTRRCAPQTCARRSEEHTSELQSLMRSSYAVFCLKKKKKKYQHTKLHINTVGCEYT